MPANVLAMQNPRSGPGVRSALRRATTAAIGLAAVACSPLPTQSDVIVNCRAQDQPADATMVLNYVGGASGTLKVSGVLGEMELSATRTDEKHKGADFEIIGIQAQGPASVPMPDKAGLERCLKDKNADPGDAGVFAYKLNLCQYEVPQNKVPVAIDASVTITIIEGPDAQVFISRTFKEESALANGRMKLDTFPYQWTCTVGEAK